MPDAPPPDDRRDVPLRADAPAAPKEAAHAGGFTLDLSSGPGAGQPASWRRKRKQASPVLTKIVDLTVPKPAAPKLAVSKPAASKPEAQAKPASKPPAPPSPTKPRPPRSEGRKDERRRPGGATLADLLDEATLARLRREK